MTDSLCCFSYYVNGFLFYSATYVTVIRRGECRAIVLWYHSWSRCANLKQDDQHHQTSIIVLIWHSIWSYILKIYILWYCFCQTFNKFWTFKVQQNSKLQISIYRGIIIIWLTKYTCLLHAKIELLHHIINSWYYIIWKSYIIIFAKNQILIFCISYHAIINRFWM